MATLRFTTAGESHGPGLVAIVEGLPAGLELDRGRIDADMARRQLGHGRGGRMKIESDSVEIRAGVRHGKTLGSPVAVLVANRDYANWEERMSPWPVEAAVEEVHTPRPGHADLAGLLKFGHDDVRNVLERASARETAARVAAGALAKELLRAFGVSVHSHVVQIGSVTAPERDDLAPEDFAGVDESPVRCLDSDASEAMVAEIDRLRKANESLGGIFEVRGLRPRSRDRLAHELGGAAGRTARPGARLDPGRKGRLGRRGVGGCGPARLRVARRDLLVRGRGLAARDQSRRRRRGRDDERRAAVVRGALKPISTLTKPLRSVDTETKEPAQALRERTDSTVVPAAGVVGEAMTALVLARGYREKFGGDHIDDAIARVRRLQGADRVAAVEKRGRGPRRAHRGAPAAAIVFIGFMGAGKTTAADAARAAGLEAVDADDLLEEELGMPIGTFFGAPRGGGVSRASRPPRSSSCSRTPTAA